MLNALIPCLATYIVSLLLALSFLHPSTNGNFLLPYSFRLAIPIYTVYGVIMVIPAFSQLQLLLEPLETGLAFRRQDLLVST